MIHYLICHFNFLNVCYRDKKKAAKAARTPSPEIERQTRKQKERTAQQKAKQREEWRLAKQVQRSKWGPQKWRRNREKQKAYREAKKSKG